METKKNNPTTDWNLYYKKPYKTAFFSRKIIEKVLINFIKKYMPQKLGLKVVELGGANSCFLKPIFKKIKLKECHVIDNNEYGLEKLKNTSKMSVFLHCQDILNLHLTIEADLVFSIGLIEHFCASDLKKVIAAHFALTKPGGLVIISFHRKSFLYKISRFFSESLNLWIFHDENPLDVKEIIKELNNFGAVLNKKFIWPIFLTQEMIVIKKN